MTPSLSDRPRRVHLVGVGIGAGLLSIAVTIVVAASTVSVLDRSNADIGTLGAVAVAAGFVGLALGVRYREQWLVPTFVAGTLTGVFLFLRGQVFLSQGEPISYPLLFGVPGAAVAVVITFGGAWVGSRSQVAQNLSPSGLSPLARAGLVVAGGWTAVELLFGIALAAPVGSALDNTFAGTLVATVFSFPIAALFAVRYGRRVGIDRDDWDYRMTSRTTETGLAAGLVTVLAVYAVGLFIASAIGTDTAVTAFGFLLADLKAEVWVLALFALAHGVVAPLAEELAWRGIVQSALVEAQGSAVGIAATAVLFTAKHAVLDVSLARLPTVLVLAIALGLVRDRWGTTASTLVHAVVNLASVIGLVILAFG